jgi:uncharacterized protein YndB with AHSA1/START domain
MKADIDLTAEYPHPPERVWAALTSSEALAAWLMPNDFRPVPGHRFTMRTKPRPRLGFDGIVRCQVLEIDPPRRMTWSWAGGRIETTVTFTVEPLGAERTRLRMRQAGFHGLGGQFTRRILASGWPGILRRLGTCIPRAASGDRPQDDRPGDDRRYEDSAHDNTAGRHPRWR